MKKTTSPKSKFRKGEKSILLFIAIFALLTPISIVYSYASLSSSNIEVEKLKKEIEKQENVNAGLSMQVDELASLSNIQDIAKAYGLSYNNDNIIVIK
ncbi:MAG: cell division protein FtsL [Erysipelotrichales bacterium]|nr:cell division protein FtsL [Erysipelotrichales bacterium]